MTGAQHGATEHAVPVRLGQGVPQPLVDVRASPDSVERAAADHQGDLAIGEALRDQLTPEKHDIVQVWSGRSHHEVEPSLASRRETT